MADKERRPTGDDLVPTAGETFRTVLLTAAGSAPGGLGPMMVAVAVGVVGLALNAESQRRARSFMTILEEESEPRITVGELRHSEASARLAEEVGRRVTEPRQEDKHREFARLLLRRWDADGPDADEENERLVGTLAALTRRQMRLLAALDREPTDSSEALLNRLRHLLPSMDDEELRQHWSELAALGLIQPYPTKSLYNGGTPPDDDERAGVLRQRLTTFGHEFVKYIWTGAGAE